MTTKLRRYLRFVSTLAAFAFLFAVMPAAVKAAAPRVLPEGQLPKDVRLKPPKDLDGYFPFTPPSSQGEWEKRAERVRRQLLVALGLWPLPTKSPLNPVIHGKIEREDYTVEKVFFESAPGFYVTGNLYRPKGKTGKLPGVLRPHGHWNNGRFTDAGEEGVRREIVQGAERFEESGRSPLQAKNIQLARMGCVVFHYDMIGYADSVQISHALAHGFSKQRPEMSTTENWGLFSPQAEAHLQSVMQLQTWNSIRALDFLLTLPEVDPERIACTGASGGGTQTFILSAIDPRVNVAFPAVMVSTAMQGGCTCENACLLRVNTGNIEIAGLFAPKPLGMTSADDWTKEMSTKGFPELKRLYTMLGVPDNVMLKRGEQWGHNYNYPSRAAMYSWFNKHLKLGLKDPIIEADFKRLTREELSVWDAQHPAPKAADPDLERKLLRWLHDDAQKQIRGWAKSPEMYRSNIAGAIDVMIGRNLPEVGEVEWDMKRKEDRGEYIEMSGLLRNKTHGEELPAIFLYPKQWNGQTVIWVDEGGKAALFSADGSPTAEIKKLLASGATVAGADLLFQGEFLEASQPLTKTRRVKNTREAAAYTFGYNHTLFAQRVHDILTVLKYVRGNERKTERLDLVGLGSAGPLVAAARAQASDAIDRAVIDTGGFRFGKVPDIHSVSFLPGGAKYDDVPGILTIGGTKPLWLAGEGSEAPETVRAAYQAAGAGNQLTTFTGAAQEQRDAAVTWLMRRSPN